MARFPEDRCYNAVLRKALCNQNDIFLSLSAGPFTFSLRSFLAYVCKACLSTSALLCVVMVTIRKMSDSHWLQHCDTYRSEGSWFILNSYLPYLPYLPYLWYLPVSWRTGHSLRVACKAGSKRNISCLVPPPFGEIWSTWGLPTCCSQANQSQTRADLSSILVCQTIGDENKNSKVINKQPSLLSHKLNTINMFALWFQFRGIHLLHVIYDSFSNENHWGCSQDAVMRNRR